MRWARLVDCLEYDSLVRSLQQHTSGLFFRDIVGRELGGFGGYGGCGTPFRAPTPAVNSGNGRYLPTTMLYYCDIIILVI